MAKKKLEYDVTTDYQAIIDQAAADGNFELAAEAEELRNRKIDETGSSYQKTYDFTKTPAEKEASQKKSQNNQYVTTSPVQPPSKSAYSPYANVDLGVQGQDQMASGAKWQDVLETYNNRFNKASTTPGLEQYANDKIQQEMWKYIQDAINAENTPAPYQPSGNRPKYTSKYDTQMDALLKEILNRDDFSYDASKDPLYQQFSEMYLREGDRAMRDTLTEAAAGAGGMNSYAITAAQQAANYYNSQLNDKIPELYQLAYEMYLSDKESKVQDLGILQNMDATQYGRYRDTMGDWENDRDFAYGKYLDDVSQGNWQKSFDYNSAVADRDFNYDDVWNNKEWEAQQEATDLANDRYDQEAAKEEIWKLIELGVTPSADLVAKAGMSQADVDLAVAAAQAEQNGGSPIIYEEGYDHGIDNWDEIIKVEEGSENYMEIDAVCANLFEQGGWAKVKPALDEARQTGALDQTSYIRLFNKYRDM